MLRLTVYGAALACLCAAVAQGQQFSVTKLVHDVAQKAESAKQYEFEGDLLLGGQRGSNPGVVIAQAKVRLAVGPEGKSLWRVDAPDKDEYLLVSDGQKSWAYVPKLKQYTEEESSARAAGPDSDNDADNDADADSGADSGRRVRCPVRGRARPGGIIRAAGASHSGAALQDRRIGRPRRRCRGEVRKEKAEMARSAGGDEEGRAGRQQYDRVDHRSGHHEHRPPDVGQPYLPEWSEDGPAPDHRLPQLSNR